MTVILIKSECPRHPGRYTLGGPCDLCVDEQFKRDTDRIMEELAERIRKALK